MLRYCGVFYTRTNGMLNPPRPQHTHAHTHTLQPPLFHAARAAKTSGERRKRWGQKQKRGETLGMVNVKQIIKYGEKNRPAVLRQHMLIRYGSRFIRGARSKTKQRHNENKHTRRRRREGNCEERREERRNLWFVALAGRTAVVFRIRLGLPIRTQHPVR